MSAEFGELFTLEDRDDEITIITITAKVIMTDEAVEEFNKRLSEVAKTLSNEKIILDFGAVIAYSVANLQNLMRFQNELNEGGKRLVLCSLQQAVWETFTASTAHKHFVMMRSINGATSAFKVRIHMHS